MHALLATDRALQGFGDTLHALAQAARELCDGLTEHARQQQRTQEAHRDATQAEAASTERALLAEEARVRLETLRESVGARVEELQQRLMQVREAVQLAESLRRESGEALRSSGESRARAEQRTQDAQATLDERAATRQVAVGHLQGFAATGLLLAALPGARRRWRWPGAPNRRWPASATTTRPGAACRARSRRTTPSSGVALRP